MPDFQPTQRSRIHQFPQRAHYDRATIYGILDEGLVCHIGFVEDDEPYVLPMNYTRDGDRLLLHGAHNSRLVRTLAAGVPVCVTVTVIDGLVVAQSAAHHSMNYRSVMISGRAAEITDDAQKASALRAFNEHFLPGHGGYALPPTTSEIRAVAVLEIPLTEASAKVRCGPPVVDQAEPGRDLWCGEIPLRVTALPPITAPGLPPTVQPPPTIVNEKGDILLFTKK